MVAVVLKEGHSADEFRKEAARAKDPDRVRRLLALAAVREGATRMDAAAADGMDRQTLRDWVHAYNADGIAGLVNDPLPGRPRKLLPEHREALRTLVEQGPDFEKDGVVRWRRADLKRIVKERFEIVVDEDTIGRVLRELGFSHISPRPQHPDQASGVIKEFKKTSTVRFMKP